MHINIIYIDDQYKTQTKSSTCKIPNLYAKAGGYKVEVSAVDMVGNEGEKSEHIVIVTSAPTSKPALPTIPLTGSIKQYFRGL